MPVRRVKYGIFDYIRKKYTKRNNLKFWKRNERSGQKVIQYACESYIDNIISQQSTLNDKNLKIEGKAIQSQLEHHTS